MNQYIKNGDILVINGASYRVLLAEPDRLYLARYPRRVAQYGLAITEDTAFEFVSRDSTWRWNRQGKLYPLTGSELVKGASL